MSLGLFTAVGIGPGADDLLTLRAVRAIEEADAIMAPRSSRADESLAGSCIRAYLKKQEILELIYPMVRDDTATRAFWRQAAVDAAERVKRGQKVVQVTIGDPLIYSTSSYLLAELVDLLPKECIRIVPGISAMQAAAAAFRQELTLQEDRMLLMPGHDVAAVEQALDHVETLVLYKVAGSLPLLQQMLRRRGLAGNARLAAYVERPDRQILLNTLDGPIPEGLGYMATLIIRVGSKTWKDLPPTTPPAAADGRVLLLTGDGKGKTTSALGMILRAVGHGQRVALWQFVKAEECGEHRALALLPGVEVTRLGLGFVPKNAGPERDRHLSAALEGLKRVSEDLRSGQHRLVVLDEICTAIQAGLLDAESVSNIVREAAPGTRVILTGRGAPPALIALADTVSEVRCVKHGYLQGIPAQDGIER